MSFIQDLLAPGARQAGDAAQIAANAQAGIYAQLTKLQQTLLGYVQNADKQGLFDPERAAERFNQDWQNQHGQDLERTGATLRHNGLRPGDSELGYNLNKEKARLDQDQFAGMENARHQALAEKLNAYSSTAAPLSGASSAASAAGNYGIQAGQIAGQAGQQVGQGLAGLYAGISPFLRPRQNPATQQFYQSW